MSFAPTIKRPYRLGHGSALWVECLVLGSFLAAASAPSPLYAIYQDAWGFSATALTVVFSIYALALLVALLSFGALSDYRGRREVILASLALEIGSMVLFWYADSLGWLVAARVLQGVATGVATSAIGAGLLDLNPTQGALINSMAPMIGLGVGALATSVLLQFSRAPAHLIFALLLVAFLVLTSVAFYLPETVQRRPGAWTSLKPAIAIPSRARVMMWQLLPINTAQWALAGFYLSLGPTLARLVTRDDAPLVGGLLISALVFSSAGAIAFWRGRGPRRALAAGAALLGVGVGVALAGVLIASMAAFFAGTMIAGSGFGAALSGSLRSLVPLADPPERAGLMSGYFVLSYLAFSLPAIAAGALVAHVGLQDTSIGFCLALMALAIAALLAMTPRRTV